MTRLVLSMSGGKDSVAMWLWARRTGLDVVPVYIDTGWEWSGHYAYLDELARAIGPFERIAAKEDFAQLVIRKRTFPGRLRKFCTEELKLKPFRAWLDLFCESTGNEAVIMLGIRREESARRADAKEREWSDFYDCEVWRPILDWTIDDVAREFHLANVPFHPLYKLGAERVGCFPCVNASKAELRLVGELAPERVGQIAELETTTGQTMFTRDRRAEKRKSNDDGPSVVPISIHGVMEWARTDRGGKQLSLVKSQTGCARWGVCEKASDK